MWGVIKIVFITTINFYTYTVTQSASTFNALNFNFTRRPLDNHLPYAMSVRKQK